MALSPAVLLLLSVLSMQLLAGFVGIIDDVPDHIAAAAAAAAAFRDNSAAGSAAALTPGEGGMPTAPRNETEKLWMELFMEPSSFYDNRKEVRMGDVMKQYLDALINRACTPSCLWCTMVSVLPTCLLLSVHLPLPLMHSTAKV